MFRNLEWCCEQQIKPLYENIKYKDYFIPIQNFYKENNIKNNINSIIDDNVIHYYIKSRDDISIIIIYPSALKYPKLIKELIIKLEEKGDIHYIKDIKLNYLMAYNLIFQLYASEKRMKKNSDIMYKINRLGFLNDNIEKEIKIIVYTLKDKTKPINGKSAEFKMELRDIFVNEDIKSTIYEKDDDRYPRGYDYMHVSDDINQSYEYAGIFFHKPSLKFLKKQRVWRMIDYTKTKLLIDKLKNFFYNYSQNELEKLMIFSSGILYSYGIREANDLDCILLENETIKSKDIEKLNNEGLDITYTNHSQEWVDELNSRAKLFGAEKYEDLINKPKYYYYFMGLKFLRLKYDIKLRFKRSRPAQLTDLLIIRQFFNYKYDLSIPDKTKLYDEKTKKDIISVVDKKKYLETIKFYLLTRYFIKLDTEEIASWINNKIKMNGGNQSNLINYANESNDKYIYPTQYEIINMGYLPNVIIYGSNKPYLYPGENFDFISIKKFCNKETNGRIKPKTKGLRIASFNLHNFITRCNQGNGPLFGTTLNPFEKSRDIIKFIDLFRSVNADIICFQELVPIIEQDIKEDITDLEYIRKNFNFDYFNKLMENLGYKYNIIGSTQKGKFYNIENRNYYYLANGIYSKIKIEDYEILGFRYLNRNIIRCKIIFNNKIIDIINTHMEYYEDYNTILESKNQVTQQFNDLEEYIEKLKNQNIILCGDFNVNLFNKNEGFRYKNWDEKTKYIRNNFINSNKTKISTNFSQNDQTDFIIHYKEAKLKSIFFFTVFTNISDHYLIFSDYI
jgi:endonuclease/exonuclease/phosphatase family metal-dependent hydrolase